jgi:tRNA modification GTPase
VIVGKPNVGKSSLLNVLLNRDRAIVSSYPGTTRDALEELIEIDGILFRLIDTAGIMKSPQHELDYLSIEKTKQQYEQGDLIIVVLDASQPVTNEDEEIIAAVKGKKCIVVCNKIDQAACIEKQRIDRLFGQTQKSVYLSAKTKTGVADLERMLVECVENASVKDSGTVLTRVRQKNAVETSLENLGAAQKGLEEKKGIELIAFDIQQAVDAIRELIGEIYTDDVLDIIFSEFCIGK